MHIRMVTTLLFLLVIAVGCQRVNDSAARDKELAELRKQVNELKGALQATSATPSVVPATPPPAEPRDDRSSAAAKTIYRELLKLQSATETGVTYFQYTERLLNAKSEIEANLPYVSDSNFRSSVELVLNVYIDAREYWSYFDRGSYRKFSQYEQMRFEPYRLTFSDGYASRSQISTIWEQASQRIATMGRGYAELLR